MTNNTILQFWASLLVTFFLFAFSECRTLRRDVKALEDLKSLVGWRVSFSWLGDDPCGSPLWPGVACSLSSSGDYMVVTRLDLHGNKLTGPIPPQIARLRNLKTLNLRWNKLQDFIPPEIGELKQLTNLYLSFNNLKGPIPKELANLPQLRYLYLQENRFTGRIPPELGTLVNLRHLDVSNNQFVGTIRELIRMEGCFPSLRYLYLNHNHLTGGIPSQLANLQNLEILYLSHNKISGPLPEELASLPRLTFLYLDHNEFSGTISDSFYQHPQLKEMYIEGNRFRQSVKPIGIHRTMVVSDSECLF